MNPAWLTTLLRSRGAAFLHDLLMIPAAWLGALLPSGLEERSHRGRGKSGGDARALSAPRSVQRVSPGRLHRRRPRQEGARRARNSRRRSSVRTPPSGRRVSRGRVQAGADAGEPRTRGGPGQHPRDADRGARGGGTRRRLLRARVQRQGGESGQCDGREQAARGDGVPGRRRCVGLDSIRRGAVRERARLRRQRRAAVSRAGCIRRPRDGHPPGHGTVLHDDSGGVPAHHGVGHAGDGGRCSCSTWASRCGSSISPSR